MPRKKKTLQIRIQSPTPMTASAELEQALTSTVQKRAHWTPADDALMVQVLKEQRIAGNQADNNWKTCVWTAVAAELNKNITIGGPKNPNGCKDHWNTLKNNFNGVKATREKTGGGWDSTRHIVELPDEVWGDFVKANQDLSRWRTTPFPLYDDIADLVYGKQATGEGAISITRPKDSSEQKPEVPSTVSGLSFPELTDDLDDEQTLPTWSLSTSTVPLTPLPPTRNRKRAASSTPKGSTQRRKSGRPSGPAAVIDVAEALRNLTESIANENSSTSQSALPPTTPMRLAKAVQKAAIDESFTKEERALLIKRFTENIAIADSYTACPDDEIRTLLVRQTLGIPAPTSVSKQIDDVFQ